MSSSILDRFIKVSGHPVLPPGRCSGCGTTGATDYIDTGIQIQFFGRVYICVACWVSTAMRSCDMVSQHNVETIKADLDVSTKLLSSAVSRIKELEDALGYIEPLRSAFGSIGPASATATPQPKPEPVVPEILEGLAGDTKQPEFKTDGAEPGSPEPASKLGSASIRDDDSSDELSYLISNI